MLEDLVATLNIHRSFPCETAAGPDPASITREVDGPQVNPKEAVTAHRHCVRAHFRHLRGEQPKQGLKE